VAALVACLLWQGGAHAESTPPPPHAVSDAKSVGAGSPLLVLFHQHPPYVMRDAAGRLSGIVGQPAARAFAKAGVAIDPHESSPPRQLEALRRNEGRVCVLGMYKAPDREKFAKYSKPVSQDQAMVGLANKAFTPPPGITTPALLADPKVTVLLKEAILYGPYLDPLLAAAKARRNLTGAEFGQMVTMIWAGRADLSFFPREEAQYYAKAVGLAATDFNLIAFADMPAGEKRYILCSMQVEDAVLVRLNAALPGL
jgi:hypothetical protein